MASAWCLVASQRRLEREAFYRSETLKKIAESQGSAANAAVEFLREVERNAMRRRREGHKLGGLITAALGLGIVVFFFLPGKAGNGGGLAIGVIPLLIGLAVFGYAYYLAPKEKE